MRAALMYGAGDVRVETVPDPKLVQPTDALVRIVRACICGSDLGRDWGATDVVAERGDEAIAKVKDLTSGDGTPVVIEAVGLRPAYDTAVGVVRVGGTISRVGAPQYEDAPVGFGSLFGRNITLTGGPAPVRAYIEELMPEILDGRLEPGKVFDRTVGLDGVPAGYQAMDARDVLKVMVAP